MNHTSINHMTSGNRTIYVLTRVLKIAFLILACVNFWGCRRPVLEDPDRYLTLKIQPCNLITKAEAEAALGGEVEVTTRPDDNGCSYDLVLDYPNRTRFGSIVLFVVTSDSPRFENFGLNDDARTEAQPVTGLGDKAVIFRSRDKPDEGAKAIQILKGDVYVAIGMSTSGASVSEDTLKSLGAKAVGRLP